jgi:uncharacterized protein (DUF608 family)
MTKSTSFNIQDIYTIAGPEIAKIYEENFMSVHFQGMSKCLQFPHTVALQGAPTCSIGISPYGLYNRLNDAGRLIMLNQKAVQFGSAPYIRIDDTCTMLTQKLPGETELPDDIPAVKNYYPAPIEKENIAMTIATPSLEIAYKFEKVKVTRRLISPLLSGGEQTLMPLGVEEYLVENITGYDQQVTLVIPRPSLVNLQEKELKPTDQDSVFVATAAVKGQKHEEFRLDGIRGVIMGSKESQNRMAIAVADVPGVSVDTQPYFCLNKYSGDLLLTADGSFYEKKGPVIRSDYGAAISLTFTLKPNESKTIPVAVVLDYPVQDYIDGKTFDRKYLKNFKDEKTRTLDLAKIALTSYMQWWERTLTIQKRIFDIISSTSSYQNDREGAFRLTRLMLNELHFPLSNAIVWIENEKGKEQARFLECFDYAYIDPSDVDWYSMVLLVLFPNIEREICQRFVDSILAEDLSPRYYHYHSSFVEARKHFQEHPEEYEGKSLIQIRDTFKIKGSVAHDLSAMPKGYPLRNVSDYAWYNNNYWVDLFPKLALRVLRNVKFLEDMDFLKKNWETLKFGFEFLQTLDIDGDGIPEGNPHEVKNTFDNLTLFGVDSYDATTYMAGCQAMSVMADMMGDTLAKEKYKASFEKADKAFEKLWREHKNKKGTNLQYYVTCYDPVTKKMNKDVWTNQLDALWYLIAIGEESFIPADTAKKILKTIYKNNRTYMGWAMCRTENGEAVESEQGQDVYTTSNYVFAQLLDYYGLSKESKEVYKAMDKVIFQYANTLISPDNLRAELEKEEGELIKGPHYIVAAYPRPGAVLTQIVIQFIKELQKQTDTTKIGSQQLKSFITELFFGSN